MAFLCATTSGVPFGVPIIVVLGCPSLCPFQPTYSDLRTGVICRPDTVGGVGLRDSLPQGLISALVDDYSKKRRQIRIRNLERLVPRNVWSQEYESLPVVRPFGKQTRQES